MISLDCPTRVERRPRRASALLLVAMAATQLATASAAGFAHKPFAVLATALGIIGLLTSLRLCTAGCIESRIASTVLSASALIGVVLAHTLGAPGASPASWTPADAFIGVAALMLAGLTIRPAGTAL
jgi:hypothetical protein